MADNNRNMQEEVVFIGKNYKRTPYEEKSCCSKKKICCLCCLCCLVTVIIGKHKLGSHPNYKSCQAQLLVAACCISSLCQTCLQTLLSGTQCLLVGLLTIMFHWWGSACMLTSFPHPYPCSRMQNHSTPPGNINISGWGKRRVKQNVGGHLR